MRAEREYLVPVIVTMIAVAVIIGGFASFTGLAVQNTALRIESAKQSFRQSDVFDANIVINPVTFLSDESIMIYVDGKVAGAVVIKQYLDENKIEYGSEIENIGQNDVEVLNLKNPLLVNLADFVTLEGMREGEHTIHVEFSKGDAAADMVFDVS